MRTKEQMIELINQPLPMEQIRWRFANGKSGRKLWYVDGEYIKSKLNEVFGPTNWNAKVLEKTKVAEIEFDKEVDVWDNGKKIKTSKKFYNVAYTSTIGLVIPNLYDDGKTMIEDCGAGTQIDADLGKAHEGALKEAITDGVKRCAICLGPVFGLDLYDKNNFTEDGDFIPYLKWEKNKNKKVDSTPAPVVVSAPKHQDSMPTGYQKTVAKPTPMSKVQKDQITQLAGNLKDVMPGTDREKQDFLIEIAKQLTDGTYEDGLRLIKILTKQLLETNSKGRS